MSNPIPQILDTGRRVARTVVQVALAIVSIAPVWPLIVHAIGNPGNGNIAVWLAASVTWVGTVAGIISRVMAVPAVNDLLARVGLAGHSGNLPTVGATEPTTETTILRAIKDNGGEFIGDPAH